MVANIKSWKEQLDEEYAKVVEDASYSTEDLDKANEAICEALAKIQAMKKDDKWKFSNRFGHL